MFLGCKKTGTQILKLDAALARLAADKRNPVVTPGQVAGFELSRPTRFGNQEFKVSAGLANQDSKNRAQIGIVYVVAPLTRDGAQTPLHVKFYLDRSAMKLLQPSIWHSEPTLEFKSPLVAGNHVSAAKVFACFWVISRYHWGVF